jgi:hypothetical protein
MVIVWPCCPFSGEGLEDHLMRTGAALLLWLIGGTSNMVVVEIIQGLKSP